MPKLTFQPVDRSPAPTGAVMFVKLAGMLLLVISLTATMYLLLRYSYSGGEKQEWQVDVNRVRTNFDPLYTTEELERRWAEKQKELYGAAGAVGLPGTQGTAANKPKEPDLPFGNENRQPPPDRAPEVSGTRQSVERARDEAREMQLANEQLKKEPVFDLADETQHFLDWMPLQDADRERTANEHAARRGRQAPANERLALQVLRKLPTPGYAAHVHEGAYFWGMGQDAADAYRGRAFKVRGRLFDLYEVKLDEPVVLNDGTTIAIYYEGAIALLDKGIARNEHPIEHRVVLFQALKLPDGLESKLSAGDGVSHEDKLVSEHIMLELSGAFLRRWAYSRPVKPYHGARKVVTQAHAPLLLAAEMKVGDSKGYEVTDELLQQVRDSLREDPRFLETEGAYYAILAAANRGDPLEVIEKIGYFDLAGEETGPRYRGQGVRVDGMIGDEYVPVILPPNISGLRRVFRAYVVHDLVNIESEKRLLVDMIEPPTGLEPRAPVRFDARYYRNVFESDSTASRVRPLLIVKSVTPYTRPSGENDLLYVGVGMGAVLFVVGILLWFVIADRRERKAFEDSQLDLNRKRLEKRGGLKLKPLPDAKGGPPTDKAPDPPPDKPADPPTA
ncbi:MAG: hypothetical protein KF696_02195 [Planctomycetes bacterium]|nr:hypothetical protein [Planctomycetota bacterium]MCW8134812.1 hypothetical protein [Planctomycetota bacterium]